MSDAAARTIEAQVAMLLRLSERTRRATDHRTGELERSAYLVLGVLAAGGPASVNGIADALRLDPSTVTRQVLAMEQTGLVTRSTDPADGRVTVVTTTPEGTSALERTRTVRTALYAEMLDAWAPDDLDALATLLTRLNADIDTWERARDRR